MKNTCPSCASENTQRAEVAWSMGTRTDSQSALAIAIARPAEKKTPGMTALAIFGVLLGLLGMLLLAGDDAAPAIVLGIISVLMILGAFAGKAEADKYNSETLPALIAEWREKWVCLKCGTVYRPEPSVTSLPRKAANG